MLLKYSQYQRRSKLGANGKPHRGSVTGSRVPNKGKGCRRGKIVSSKKLNGHKNYAARREEERVSVMTVDPVCDNSNDSGLGFDHADQPSSYVPQSTSFNNHTYWSEEGRGVKRQRVDIKLESDNANDNFTFPQVVTVQQQPQRIFVDKVRKDVIKGRINGGKITSGKMGGKARSIGKRGVTDAIARSRDGTVCLEILSQPENQHRARYQTEGSRGAVKDTTGNSFPLVKLSGYGGSEPAVLQVYIGTDQGKVAPHMFYQACKVSGKNSTPCVENKQEGTVIIEIEFEPAKDNLILCDCVGILKERNVDVEHRFPEEATARSRKKSTRCRMVFKTTITLPNGQTETLQVTSHPIACTQPPGVPEICKKSLSSCPVSGNIELFIIGKNFLKDTKVKFFEGEPSAQDYWECVVQPDKEYLHQSHLVCTVPRYKIEDIKEGCNVNVCVVSGGKSSDPVNFFYTPTGSYPSQHMTIVPTSSPTPTNFFAVTPTMATANQTILQVSDRSSFSSPQKILIIPSNLDLSSSAVSQPALSPDNKDLLKTENVWIDEKIGVVQGITQASNLIQAPSLTASLDLVQAPSLVSSANMAQAPSLDLVQAANLVPSSNLVQAPNLDLVQASSLVSQNNMVQTSSLDLVQANGMVQAPIVQSPSLLQTSPSQAELNILGVSPVSGMIQTSSASSSPSLLQDSSVSQQSNLLAVSQTSPLMQISAEMVHASGVLQSSPSSNVLHSSSGMLHSPELSSGAPSSPVYQTSPLARTTSPLQNALSESSSMDSLCQASNLVHSIVGGTAMVSNQSSAPLQTSLSNSPVMDTLAQASNLVHNIVSGSGIVQTQNLTSTDFMSNSPPQNISSSSSIVSSLNSLMSPPIESPTSIIQGSPLLSNSPSMVLSPNMVHSQSPPTELSSSSSLLQGSSVMDTTNINPANLIQETSVTSGSNLVPVSSIAEASNIIQNNPLIENPMVQNNNLVNSVNILNSNLPNTLSSAPMVERSNILQDGCNTSVARGLESATPGGAANAVADLNSGQVPSMATIEKFVTATPLPALSVENYLSHIENKPKVSIGNFPAPPTTEASPIAIKQMVAALDQPKPEPQMSFPGKMIGNITSEVTHNPVIMPPLENNTTHINFEPQSEFLPSTQPNMPLLPPRPEQAVQAFPSPQFPPTQIFPPQPIYQETQPNQEKPKPVPSPAPNTKKCEEGIPVPHELTVMSDNDLISYINPSCFDQV